MDAQAQAFDVLHILLTSPFAVLSIALYFHEFTSAYNYRKICVALLSVLFLAWTISQPRFDNPFLNYVWGILSGWYGLVLTPAWMFLQDPTSYRRAVQQQNQKCIGDDVVLAIQKFPPPYTRDRAAWILDLTINLRGIGWSQGVRRDSPWMREGSVRVGKDGIEEIVLPSAAAIPGKELLRTRACRFLVDAALLGICSFLAADRDWPSPSKADPSRLIFTACWWIARAIYGAVHVYSVLDGIHSLAVLANATYLLLSRPSQPLQRWMFPPRFGASFSCNLGAFWTKTWHDTFQLGLAILGRGVQVPGVSKPIARLIPIFLGFWVSGLFHATGSYAVSQDVWSSLKVIGIFGLQPFPAVMQKILVDIGAPRVIVSSFGFCWIVITANLLISTSELRLAFQSVVP